MTDVLAPVAGLVRPLADVPDPVFAAEMVGAGVAIEPSGGRADAVSPVAGTLLKLHPHAFVVLTPEGSGVLVHLGIDTVRLQGAGFELLVSEKDTVAAGQPVTAWWEIHAFITNTTNQDGPAPRFQLPAGEGGK